MSIRENGILRIFQIAVLLIAICARGQEDGVEFAEELSVEVPAGESAPGVGAASGDIMSEYARMAAGFAIEVEAEKDIFFYRCQHVRSETMRYLLENFLTPSGTVADSYEADMVVVSDVVANLVLLRRIAAEADQPVGQVLVEARVVEFTIDSQFEKQVGLEFQYFNNLSEVNNLPAGSMDFIKRLTESFVGAGTNPTDTQGRLSWMHYDPDKQSLLTMFIKFLETKGRAQILSAPNLILRRGREGSIITGEEVPIRTQTITSGSVSTSTEFKSVGIKLRVTPVMISGDKVRLEVSPEVSNVTRFDVTGAPIIAVRSANTELELRDGQLVSIGGLLRNEERQTTRRVPFLADLPLLGFLFRGKDVQSVQTQLVIFLTVHILKDDALNMPLVRPGEIPADVQNEIEAIEKSMETD